MSFFGGVASVFVFFFFFFLVSLLCSEATVSDERCLGRTSPRSVSGPVHGLRGVGLLQLGFTIPTWGFSLLGFRSGFTPFELGVFLLRLWLGFTPFRVSGSVCSF